MSSFNIDTVKNVLLLMPDKHMGNLVVSLSTIKALRDLFADCRMSIVVDSAYGEIAEALGSLDTIILYPRKELKKVSAKEQLSMLYGLCRQLRKTAPDIAIDLDGRQASALMTLISGARHRIGRATSDMPYFYNRKVRVSEGTHKIHTYLDIAASLGADTENIRCDLRVTEESTSSVKKKLSDAGAAPDRPFVCIHPGSGKVYKQWRSDGFAAVGDRLISAGYQVVFIGTGSDADKTAEITQAMKNSACDLNNKIRLGELMALLRLSTLFIGNDSGPMHLAAALNVPLVTLFGPADERRWGPLSRNSMILRGERPCPECEDRNCKYNYKCITGLSPEKVMNAVEKMLRMKAGQNENSHP